MDRFYKLVGGLVMVVVLSIPAQGATHYAKVTATGSGNCGSWANACTLSNAIATAGPGDRVWVKAGTYPPFDLKEGVKIIGGFAGTEFSVVQSNPVENVTVVDGGGVQRTVYGENQSASTMLRGFTIRNGYAGYDTDEYGGGGLMLSDSSALIVQCIFENNTAYLMGGAVMVTGKGSPQFINCIFRNNGSTTPDDPPYEGGAVFLTAIAPVSFTNCLFHGNKAGGGGAVSKVPGTFAYFTNCTMTNNQATMIRGGAIRDESGAVSLRNCILWGNSRIEAGIPLADQIHSPGYDARVEDSDVEGGWPGLGNINADPQFANPAANNYALLSTSPCKDAGDTCAVPPDYADLDWDSDTFERIPKDLALLPRVRLLPVDMGAYEILELLPLPPNPRGPIMVSE